MKDVEFSKTFESLAKDLNKSREAALPDPVRAILNRPLPPEAVRQHPTKTYLSTIKAIFVIDRLNEAFGIGEWYADYEIIDNSKADIIVKAVLLVPKYGIYLTNFGGNDNGGQNSKNFDQGDAYKGACTDALTKIASYLGIGADIWRGEKQPSPQGYRKQPAPPPKTGANGNSISKKPLGDQGFQKVLKRFAGGELDVFEKAEKIFELSDEQRKAIKELVD
jgi:hypothetical protein